MKRRDFLRKGGIALAGMPLIGTMGAGMLAASPVSAALNTLTSDSNRVLVLVQLAGGNDGLNTLIPITSSVYYDKRPTLAISKTEALSLNDQLGWHPSLAPLKRMFDEEELAIVQGVTYPNPNLSHFRSTDIWLTATDSNVFENTGWLGRYLETMYPTYPEQLPPDPVAIQIGTTASLGLQSSKGSFAVTFTDPDEFYRLVGESEAPDDDMLPDTPAGDELEYIRKIAAASQIYAARVKDASGTGRNSAEYPAGNPLAEALQIVARLIAGGLQTKVYLVSVGGNIFDTHAAQADTHAGLLSDVALALEAFSNDTKELGIFERVAGITFSEFGRRVEENGSEGTDHGTAAPLFAFGGGVIGGRIHGAVPNLNELDDRGNLLIEFDYRQVYASALAQWFAEPTNEIQQVLFKDFATLPLFKDQPTSVNDTLSQRLEVKITPQPATTGKATVRFTLPTGANMLLSVVTMRGEQIAKTSFGYLQAGEHILNIPTDKLSSGTYMLVLQADRMRIVEKFSFYR